MFCLLLKSNLAVTGKSAIYRSGLILCAGTICNRSKVDMTKFFSCSFLHVYSYKSCLDTLGGGIIELVKVYGSGTIRISFFHWFDMKEIDIGAFFGIGGIISYCCVYFSVDIRTMLMQLVF